MKRKRQLVLGSNVAAGTKPSQMPAKTTEDFVNDLQNTWLLFWLWSINWIINAAAQPVTYQDRAGGGLVKVAKDAGNIWSDLVYVENLSTTSEFLVKAQKHLL